MKTLKKSTSDYRHLSTAAVYWAEKSFEKTSITKTTFAAALAEHSQLSHIFKRPHINMPVSEYQRISQANLKKIQRYLNFETRLPADILPFWADCLPTPYADYLRHEVHDNFYPTGIEDANIGQCIKLMAIATVALLGSDEPAKNKALHDVQESIKALMGDV